MTSDPPTAVAQDVARLRAALDDTLPTRTGANLLIGTWNVRAFGDLTKKWTAGPRDSPKRDLHAMACIAEIASRFDVLALQEVRRSTTALHYLMGLLGPGWRFITSDVTEGSAGNRERLTYLYDTAGVRPSSLVGEILLPPGTDGPVPQFARTPYAAGSTRGKAGFVLASVHVLWGDKAADRLPELTAFAQWMRDWAERPDDWNENLLVLGDFNLDRIGNPLYEAFVATGLWPPTELGTVPRTIFDNDKTRHFYDQIAWFSEPDGTSMLQTLTYTGRARHIDFLPHILTDLTKNEVS